MNSDYYYSDFFIDKPEFEIILKEFSEKFNIATERKLKTIKCKDEFLAEIIEYRFGIFFGSMFKNIQHEYKIFPGSQRKPDWTITSESQTIVAEVIRLNPSKGDAEEMKLSDTLMDGLYKVAGDYLVQLQYKYDEVKDLLLNQEHFESQAREWIYTNPSEGDYMTFGHKIKIIVKQKDIGLTKVNAMSPFVSIRFDYRRLAGEESRLFEKLDKYADLANKHNLPYLICLHLSFESWFKPEDMYTKLYGCSGVFHGDEPFNEYYPDAVFHTYADGLYYCNDIIKNCVSGVIVYYQNEFTFFPNYSDKNRLSNDSMQLLNAYLYNDLKS